MYINLLENGKVEVNGRKFEVLRWMADMRRMLQELAVVASIFRQRRAVPTHLLLITEACFDFSS
jgi:hypothetical protein